jgi:hypothetical protein
MLMISLEVYISSVENPYHAFRKAMTDRLSRQPKPAPDGLDKRLIADTLLRGW